MSGGLGRSTPRLFELVENLNLVRTDNSEALFPLLGSVLYGGETTLRKPIFEGEIDLGWPASFVSKYATEADVFAEIFLKRVRSHESMAEVHIVNSAAFARENDVILHLENGCSFFLSPVPFFSCFLSQGPPTPGRTYPTRWKCCARLGLLPTRSLRKSWPEECSFSTSLLCCSAQGRQWRNSEN